MKRPELAGRPTGGRSFNPILARVARQSRGLSQAELAKRLQVSQGTVSRYESHWAEPNEDYSANLANVLQYPVSLFHRHDWQHVGFGIHELHHRRRRRVPAREMTQIHAISALQWNQLQELLVADPDQPMFPYIPIGEIAHNPADAADVVRAYWRLPLGRLDNLTGTVERGGGIVILGQFGTRRVDGFSLWAHPAAPVFWLNRDMPPDRMRWTLAHELGHAVMHTGEGEARQMEDEADAFAAQLLMPAEQIHNQLVGLTAKRLPGLKRDWGVSMQALIKRAYDLGLISRRKQQRLFAELTRAGYRIREPRSLDPPIETPARVRALIDLHTNELEYSEDQFCALLGAFKDDIWRLASDHKANLRVIAGTAPRMLSLKNG